MAATSSTYISANVASLNKKQHEPKYPAGRANRLLLLRPPQKGKDEELHWEKGRKRKRKGRKSVFPHLSVCLSMFGIGIHTYTHTYTLMPQIIFDEIAKSLKILRYRKLLFFAIAESSLTPGNLPTHILSK